MPWRDQSDRPKVTGARELLYLLQHPIRALFWFDYTSSSIFKISNSLADGFGNSKTYLGSIDFKNASQASIALACSGQSEHIHLCAKRRSFFTFASLRSYPPRSAPSKSTTSGS